MIKNTLKTLFNRDLEKLKTEIGLYKNESRIWVVEKEISNSAGNLCLHLVGNLNAFIGATLGNTDYVRQRELEFSLKNIPQLELIHKVEETQKVVESVLNTLSEEDFGKEFPVLVFKEKTTTGYMLIHLSTHLGYHLGQINYHRRLLDN